MVAKCLFLCVLRPSHPHKNPYAFFRSTLFLFLQSLHLFSFLRTDLIIIKSYFHTCATEYKNVGYRMQRCPVHSICYCCSVTKSFLTLCDPMDCSTPGFPVLHPLPEFTQTHVHWVGDAIQLSHPLLSTSASVLPMNIQDWFPLDWLVWSPCCPGDSQEIFSYF